MRKNKGFTLVEILIVVVILGILAAIVIPQFSDASTQSKVSNMQSSLQTMRSQLSLYKIQHNDTPPVLATFEDQMTLFSDISGGTSATRTATHIYGPYLQSVPNNPFTNFNTVVAPGAAADTAGWEYVVAADGITATLNAAADSTADSAVHQGY